MTVMDDDLDVDLGYEDVEHAKVVLKKKFLPWHKPRKQYIRINQWNYFASSLVKALGINEEGKARSLEYLSLPGADLLDVRSLHSVCSEMGVKIKFKGLNYIPPEDRESMTDQLISINELRGLQYIDAASDVYPDHLEQLANKKSIAYQQIISQASTYDVINIDLCGSFLEAPPQDRQPNYYKALFELLRYQADRRTEDWLFFITTRTNKDMVHLETFKRFVDVMEGIFGSDNVIYQKFVDLGLVNESALEGKKIVVDKIDGLSYSNLVSAGIGKWVLNALTDHMPAHNSKMLKTYGYNVHSNSDIPCDMVSFGFWCKRLPVKAVDTFGLAAGGINQQARDVSDVVRVSRGVILSSVSAMANVDDILNDADEFSNALRASSELMRSARYDVEEYEAWARAEHEKTKMRIISDSA